MKDIYRVSFHLYYLINLFLKPLFLPKSLPEINLFFLLVKKDYFLLSHYLNLFNKGPEFFCITRGLLLIKKILYTDSLKNNYGNANEND